MLPNPQLIWTSLFYPESCLTRGKQEKNMEHSVSRSKNIAIFSIWKSSCPSRLRVIYQASNEQTNLIEALT